MTTRSQPAQLNPDAADYVRIEIRRNGKTEIIEADVSHPEAFSPLVVKQSVDYPPEPEVGYFGEPHRRTGPLTLNLRVTSDIFLRTYPQAAERE